jgi:hypothetical protein
MNASKILYSSTDVRNAIIELFSKSRGRRIAITAFVGSGAESYLPKPEGLELICWPKAGGTNPDAIRKLLKQGVKIQFADALHMKVYWTEDKGAVLTSANLSTNALGAGGLAEIGILMPSKNINIGKIIQSLKRRKVTEKELDKLDREHFVYHARNPFPARENNTVNFSEWYSLPNRQAWKIGYFSSYGSFSSAAKEIAKAEFDVREPDSSITCAENTYKKSDRVLTFLLGEKTISNISWVSVDYIVRTPKTDKEYMRGYPFQAIQVWPDKRYPPPPFKIDKKFRYALAKAIRTMDIDEFRAADPNKPSKRLLELIKENY